MAAISFVMHYKTYSYSNKLYMKKELISNKSMYLMYYILDNPSHLAIYFVIHNWDTPQSKILIL